VGSEKHGVGTTLKAGAEHRPRPGDLQLVVAGGEQPATVALPPRGAVIVGRAPSAHVRIDDPLASREHVRIEIEGGRAAACDLGSSNGTKLGGEPLGPDPVPFLPGEVLAIGSTLLMLQELHARATPPGTPSVSPPRAAPAGADASAGDGAQPIVVDDRMRDIYAIARLTAQSSASVLVLGETGVGKDVLARFVHAESPRRTGPFVHVDLGALGESLLESELYGHARGSFTGATQDKVGLLESAHGGTVFLNEIGELSAPAQVKLLRAVEEQRVRRVGETKDRRLDVRFVAATNRDLPQAIQAGTFREDLYFRLAVVTLVVPPLRDRLAEIEPLARAFAERLGRRDGRRAPIEISPEAISLLEGYGWPGNVRELSNVIERASVLCAGGTIGAEHLPDALRGAGGPVAPPERPPPSDERQLITDALQASRWRIEETAAALAISRTTLWKRMRALGIPLSRRGPAR
jgi:two-component system, NtrC family, response regulator AtoC